MERYQVLREIFKHRRCFKLVCGAGNEDTQEVRRLTLVFTLAGATIFDLSANVDVVRSAKKGIEQAYVLAPALKRAIPIRPYLNVSVGIKGDPHVRKAKIAQDICVKCGSCISACKQQAIDENYKVWEYRCIGCGQCEAVCSPKAVSYIHRRIDIEKVLAQCIEEGVELAELHAVTLDDEGVFKDWEILNKLVKDNFISMCLDRSLLSNRALVERVSRAHKAAGEHFIVQADGVPMSGDKDDYNCTLQAVACADIVQKSSIPAMILLSGGTNSKSGLLAKQCGITAHGVAVGSFARKMLREFTSKDDLDGDILMIKRAVSMADELIRINIEAISG